ncbi:histidine kinase-like ATPase [Gorgonomyces haynaldii]|nr:histidine kinase-like ATPase [Gorgonomyces haynaldii]
MQQVLVSLASKKLKPISLQQLHHIDLLKQELPIRYTHSLKMMTSPAYMPPALAPVVQPLAKQFLNDLLVISQTSDRHFQEQLPSISRRHLDLMNQFNKISVSGQLSQDFYDRFYTINLSSHLLMQEYLSLVEHNTTLIQQVVPLDAAVKASQKAKQQVLKKTGQEGPDIQVLNFAGDTPTLYVEPHLVHMLYELLKNSLLASIKHHSKNAPPIKLVIAEGSEDVSFKVSDESGGVPLSFQPKLFHYGVTKEPPSSQDPGLRVFGHGLARSRLLARYFGGDIEFHSMEGFGSDCFLHLYRKEQTETFPSDNLVQEDPSWMIQLLKSQ